MIHIQPRRVLSVLVVVNCLLIGGFIFFKHVPLSMRSITRLFDMTAEASVPAWYSAMLLATAGLLALLRGLTLRATRGFSWQLYLAIGAGFLFLSADEVGQIHETISGGLHKHLDAGAARSDDASAWDAVTFAIYFIAAGAVLLMLWRQALALFFRSPGRWGIVAGGVIYAMGTSVVDQFQASVPLGLGAALEDGCEVFGATLMLYGFLVNLDTVAISTAGASADSVAADGLAGAATIAPAARPAKARDRIAPASAEAHI